MRAVYIGGNGNVLEAATPVYSTRYSVKFKAALVDLSHNLDIHVYV